MRGREDEERSRGLSKKDEVTGQSRVVGVGDELVMVESLSDLSENGVVARTGAGKGSVINKKLLATPHNNIDNENRSHTGAVGLGIVIGLA